jgi:hypothetical protein
VREFVAVGSLDALRDVLEGASGVELSAAGDVVIVTTAAAFIGVTEAAIELSFLFEDAGARVEALMNVDRSSSDEPYFAQRVRDADLVVLADGSALHAKSVWHASALGEAIRDAERVVAVGTVASVPGATMIDPRGGAPTTGLGYFDGLVITTRVGEEQLNRTRSLLGADVPLAVLGPRGVVRSDGARWRVMSEDVVTTRALEVVTL